MVYVCVSACMVFMGVWVCVEWCVGVSACMMGCVWNGVYVSACMVFVGCVGWCVFECLHSVCWGWGVWDGQCLHGVCGGVGVWDGLWGLWGCGMVCGGCGAVFF